jgi:4-aminobutyrate aminotransferase-like enzyme/Ser/Thr protein kinase RdoA (MazF antagonist)
VTDASTPTELVQPAPPEISDQQAAVIAYELFGIDARARSLGSHQDRNFLLQSPQGRALLKIANPATTAAELEAQNRAADHLATREPGLRFSRSHTTPRGGAVESFVFEGHTLLARMLDFVEGAPLSGGGYLTPATVRAIGTLTARVTRAFEDFDDTSVERPHQWDLRRSPEVLARLLPFVDDEGLRSTLENAAAEAWAVVERHEDLLPLQVIHGDLTDDNIVARDGSTLVDGVIDLGDLNRSWAVGELAVTLSSLLHHTGGGIVPALRALSAYSEIRALDQAEARVLWPLVVLRAAILVASGHHVGATDPGNEYAAQNLVHEIAIFERASALPLTVATALVFETMGTPADDASLPPFVAMLPTLDADRVTVLDLSPTSPLLHRGRWLASDVEVALVTENLRPGAAVLTRFAEPRLTRSAIHSSDEPVNVALGIELHLAESHAVVAPWAGRVSGDANSLTLEHNGLLLTLRGVAGKPRSASAGQVIARAQGRLSVSLASAAGAPEFTTATLSRAWRSVVLDPTALVLGTGLELHGAGDDGLLERRRAHLAAAQEFYFDEPPVMVRGWKEHLIDADGRVYLDVVNNVTSIGHAHPRLVDAVTEQWSLLNTNSRFNYPAVADFAERLSALLPEGLDSVFLVNSGTEAVDLALRIARTASGRDDVLAVREAYHGWSDLADAVSTSIADNPGALTTRPHWVHPLDAPNSYRGIHRGDDAQLYAGEAVERIEQLAASGTPAGAFIAESFYGNAGGMPLPDGYLASVYAAVRAAGGLCIADEVQVGYGRLGDWFWGFEQQKVVPDIVAVAKAMGNGHPLGAVVTSSAIAERFRSHGYFFSSAGGSPVSSVVGTTVLDVIRDERLQHHAAETGSYLKSRLSELGDRHPLVGAVHGSGFYLGLEFVRDRVTLEPAPRETMAICERLRELGVVVQPTSDRQCVLKIKPPLCLTRESADFFVAALDKVLSTGY